VIRDIMPTPSIDEKKCTSCGNCIQLCPMQVFKKQEEKVVVDKPKECIGCKACEVQCDKQAIKIIEEEKKEEQKAQ